MGRLYVLIFLGVMIFANAVQAAEQFPARPINYIVATEAGSDGDILARPICQKVSAILGQPLVVVNKPGAGGSIGYREIYNSKPNGHTIGIGFVTIVTNKLLGILPYDHEAFTVLGAYATYVPIIVASTKTQRPFKTMEEVIKFARANPARLLSPRVVWGKRGGLLRWPFKQEQISNSMSSLKRGRGLFRLPRLPEGMQT